jgi:hypothetical protein
MFASFSCNSDHMWGQWLVSFRTWEESKIFF